MAHLRPMREPKTRPVRPNAGIEAEYRRRLQGLVDEMGISFLHWVRAAYRANEPRMALDATPASQLRITLNELRRRWQKAFDQGADDLAKYFARSARRQSDAALAAILRKAGYSVRFEMTAAMRDVATATVNENVQLIRSIPQKYFTEVQGAVMRSVQMGRDLSVVTQALEDQIGVAKRRAAFIALDQNNKATAAMTRTRQTELGVVEGIWQHSHAGKKPRRTHVANNGKRFSLKTGWYDPDPKVRRHILPSELINCRCTWRPVIPGF